MTESAESTADQGKGGLSEEAAWWREMQSGNLPRDRGGYTRQGFAVGYAAGLAARTAALRAERDAAVAAALEAVERVLRKRASFVQDGSFWLLLSYCAGVGGSMLIIGSAAGVVVMGLEKMNFGWYMKHISWIAFVGYIAGIICYWFIRTFLYAI